MNRVPSAAAAVAALAALATALPARATSCAFTLEWNGTTYHHVPHRAELQPGRSLGEGVVPACDVGEGDRDRDIAVRAVDGVPARYAVTADELLFVAEGYPVALRQHPAHDLVHGARDAPDERRNCRSGARTVSGRLRVAATFSLPLHSLPEPVAVDARTRLDGLPELGEGDRLRVEALTCEGEGPGTRLLVAREIVLVEDVAAASDDRAVDPDVVVGAALTGALFAAGFGARALRRRRREA